LLPIEKRSLRKIFNTLKLLQNVLIELLSNTLIWCSVIPFDIKHSINVFRWT